MRAVWRAAWPVARRAAGEPARRQPGVRERRQPGVRERRQPGVRERRQAGVRERRPARGVPRHRAPRCPARTWAVALGGQACAAAGQRFRLANLPPPGLLLPGSCRQGLRRGGWHRPAHAAEGPAHAGCAASRRRCAPAREGARTSCPLAGAPAERARLACPGPSLNVTVDGIATARRNPPRSPGISLRM
jgi:hypothetical protein